MKKYNLEKILPHNPPMILIDNILEINLDKRFLIADVTITPDKMFFDKTLNGVSSLCGIEFMAQTIGCYAYFKRRHKRPEIGFLLGTRLYNNLVEVFENGKTYTIKVCEVFMAQDIVSFECIIYDENAEEISSATINVYQGDNAEELIANE